ncbi:MAG: GNAT family N-acetyltransferase [Actinomycetota bacterium]
MAMPEHGEGSADRFTQELELTGYRPGDEHAILGLFRETFGQERGLESWRWRYEGLAGNTEHILLVRDREGNLCGHYASQIFTVVYREKEIMGALRLDFMVHPDFQRKGIGGLLIDASRKHLAERCSLHISFPNPNSTSITRKKRPHFMDEAPIYWRLADVGSLFKAAGLRSCPPFFLRWANAMLRSAYRLLELPTLLDRGLECEVGTRFAELLPESPSFRRQGCGIYFKRDAAFLRWRFDENPERDYTLLFLGPRGGARGQEGYAVLAVMEYQGFSMGFIVDLLADPPRSRTIRYVLSRALKWFREQEVEAVTCMMSGRNAYTRALKSLGFVKVPNRFLPRALNISLCVYDPGLDRDYVCNLDNWIITWADTDLA